MKTAKNPDAGAKPVGLIDLVSQIERDLVIREFGLRLDLNPHRLREIDEIGMFSLFTRFVRAMLANFRAQS